MAHRNHHPDIPNCFILASFSPKRYSSKPPQLANRPQRPGTDTHLHEAVECFAPEPFLEDADVPFAPGFGLGFWADIVAELDSLAAVEAFVGLFVPACRAIGVGGDGVSDGFGVVALELEGYGTGGGDGE